MPKQSDSCPRCEAQLGSQKYRGMDPLRLDLPFIAAGVLCAITGRAMAGKAIPAPKEYRASIVSKLVVAGTSGEAAFDAIRIAEDQSRSLLDPATYFAHWEDTAQRICDLLKPHLEADQFEALALGFDFSSASAACEALKILCMRDIELPDPPSSVLDFAADLFVAALDARRDSEYLTVVKDRMRRHLDSASRHASALGLTWIDISSLGRVALECTTDKEFAFVRQTFTETAKYIMDGLLAKGSKMIRVSGGREFESRRPDSLNCSYCKWLLGSGRICLFGTPRTIPRTFS